MLKRKTIETGRLKITIQTPDGWGAQDFAYIQSQLAVELGLPGDDNILRPDSMTTKRIESLAHMLVCTLKVEGLPFEWPGRSTDPGDLITVYRNISKELKPVEVSDWLIACYEIQIPVDADLEAGVPKNL